MRSLLLPIVIVIFLPACQTNTLKTKPSKVTALYTPLKTTCCAEASSEELELYRLLNEYRVKNSLPKVPLSPSLTYVAQTHARDLSENPPKGKCNMHSWSSSGKWSACCYTSDHAQAQCMWNKPRELTGYPGNGYENAYRVTSEYKKLSARSAINSWIKSRDHNAVILNQGIWNDYHWQAVGIGIYGNYAVLWFGNEADPAK